MIDYIKDAVNEFDAKWARDHKEEIGTCGCAVVAIYFGRKRKLKKEFLDSGVINENNDWEFCGKKGYVVNLAPSSKVRTQNVDFYEKRAKVVRDVIEKFLDGTGVEVRVHSWVD